MITQKKIILWAVLTQFLFFVSCASLNINNSSNFDVALYCGAMKETVWLLDIITYERIAKEIGLKSKRVNHDFINEKKSFFHENGDLKIKVLVIPGCKFEGLFGPRTEGPLGPRFQGGINCIDIRNIFDFVRAGGSVIGLCWIGSAIFSSDSELLQPSLMEAKLGLWDRTHKGPGPFYRRCGLYAFKGLVKGPQETNRPYPKQRFLPITMNMENEIVKSYSLPPVIYQTVVGGGSIFPSEGQELDVVGWYANGKIAIGIVPYGKGHIIMSNPHPNITKKDQWIEGWERHARELFWTEDMISKEKAIMKNLMDPDGPEADLSLAKAMLSYAHKKASK